MANKAKADLFISIHCNAVHKHRVSGTETYVMGLHTAQENLLVAKRENASILYEKNFKSTYEGYEPGSAEGHIILSMFQNAHLEKSIDFANKVESSFKKRTPMRSRGVKQAGFVVLRQATMPSILVETGFLTNKSNESYLVSSTGQDEVAQAIVLAFTEYKQEQEQIQEVVLVQEEREEDVPLVDLEIKEKEEDAQEQPSVHLSEQVQMIEIAEVQDSVQEQNPGQALLKSIDSEEKPTQSPLDEPLPINYKVQNRCIHK